MEKKSFENVSIGNLCVGKPLCAPLGRAGFASFSTHRHPVPSEMAQGVLCSLPLTLQRAQVLHILSCIRQTSPNVSNTRVSWQEMPMSGQLNQMLKPHQLSREVRRLLTCR